MTEPSIWRLRQRGKKILHGVRMLFNKAHDYLSCTIKQDITKSQELNVVPAMDETRPTVG